MIQVHLWCPHCGAKNNIADAIWQSGRNGFESRGSITCVDCNLTWDELGYLREPPPVFGKRS